MCSQRVYIYECRFTEEAAIVSRMPLAKLPVLDERLRISSSKLRPVLSALHDVPIDLAEAQSTGPPQRRHYPALVTRQPSKALHLGFPRRIIYDHFPHRQRRRHILAASSPLSSRPWYPRLPSPVPSSRRGQALRSGIVEDRVTSGSAATRSPSPLMSATHPPRALPPPFLPCGK